MLSHDSDADANPNPFELDVDRLMNLDMAADFLGKAALRRIRDEGVCRKQVGLMAPLQGLNATSWSISQGTQNEGKVTSAVYSQRLKKNIALAIVSVDCTALGTELDVNMPTAR